MYFGSYADTIAKAWDVKSGAPPQRLSAFGGLHSLSTPARSCRGSVRDDGGPCMAGRILPAFMRHTAPVKDV